MQTALNYRTNRDLFSNYYLNEHLPETEAWDELTDDELREAKADIMELWDREKETAPKRNESQLEEKFIRPMFRKLGIPFEVEESTSRTQRRPDYGFFESEDAARDAFERREEGNDFYKNAVAVADAKRWGRPLDTRGSGEHKRDFENPSYQIHVYLQEVDDAQWAVLTDGKKWRLYYGPTSHRLDSYYEIDLPTVLKKGDLEDFKYFYLFFRHGAFLEDSSGDCFLDDVYEESNVFARELGEDLQDNIYEAIKVLSEGFMQYPDNDLSEGDLDLIHDSSLIYLYRLIFVLYAESEGRDLLDTSNEIYEESYSLNTLKQEVAEELDSADPKYRDWQDNLWDRLDELFKLIDQGSKSRGIPEEDLYIPAYNGGLFRTDPKEDDSVEARFIATHQVGDAYLAKVIDLLTRSQNGSGGGKIFVDYSSLDVRHLGSIYEGLLEYQLNVTDEALTLENGEYIPAGESDEVIVEEGEVHLSTDSGERKATGSYYTPEYVVEYIVEETLGPLVEDIRMELAGQSAYDEGGFAEEFAEEVFNLKILDPAMGSGHFLTSAIDYLAREIIDAQERQAAQQGIETVDEEHDINWARRQVAQRCIYGVDLNPLAVELAKVSLWLRTLAAEQPLAFLDHHLKTGNSLIGSDIQEVLDNGDDTVSNDGQLTLEESFAHTQQQALEHVMERFQELLSIDNESLAEVKEMEATFEEVQDDPLYQHLLSMVNVYTAEEFGLDVPDDAYKRMAEALRGNSWDKIEIQDWFNSAQAIAAKEHFFHWELEFPVAFYDNNGNRKTDAGFDAVIGNPPYGDILSRSQKEAIYNLGYKSGGGGNNDVFRFFVEKGVTLSQDSSLVGFILPNTCLDGSKYGIYRERISNISKIDKMIDFKTYKIFNAEVYTHIFITKALEPESEYTTIYKEITGDLGDYESRETLITPGSTDTWFPKSDIYYKLKENDNTIKLSNICESADAGINYQRVDVGWQNREDSKIADRILYTGEKEDEGDQEYIKGEDIEPHLISIKEKKWLRGNYDELVKEGETVSVNEEWAETVPKIVNRQTGDTIIAAVDEGGYYTGRSLHSTKVINNNYSEYYIVSVLNSKVIDYYYTILAREQDRSMAQVNLSDVRNLPIPQIDFQGNTNQEDRLEEVLTQYNASIEKEEGIQNVIALMRNSSHKVIHDVLEHCSKRLSSLKETRYAINLDILDYIQQINSFDGPELGELYQPPSGLHDTMFTSTTSEYEGLRFESIRVENKSDKLIVFATARYKPSNEDQYETDRWGFTETKEQPVMEFIDVPDKQASLIRAFVPRVFRDELNGFMKEARKSITLLERLTSIQLPSIDSIEDDLHRYEQQRKRAETLDQNIKITKELINKSIYCLYELSEEEVSTIEETVGE